MKIKQFVTQAAVSLSDYKKLAPKTVIKNYRSMYCPLFGPQALRIAFKIHSAYDATSLGFELPEQIKEYLKSIYYTVSKTNPRQAIYKNASKYSEITKILSKQKDSTAKEMLILFNRENQKFLKDDSVPVWCIISRYARDYLGQSFDKSWDSCKNITDGKNRQYLRMELNSGYLCAYFVRTSLNLTQLVKTNGRSNEKQVLKLIDRSLGRMLLVPYRYGPVVAGTPDANTILIPAQLTYGFVPQSAKTELKHYLNENLNEKVFKTQKAVKVYVAPGYPDSNPAQNFYGVTEDNINDLNSSELFEAIEADKEKITLIKDPAKQLQVLKQCPEAIQYLRHPSEEMQLQCMDYNEGQLIRLIRNPSESTQLLSVTKNGRNLKFLRGASNSVKLRALKQNGFALKYLADPTEEMINTALHQNGNALQFVAVPTKEQIKLAVGTSGSQAPKLKKVKTPDFKDTYGEEITEDEPENEHPDFDAAEEDDFWNKTLEGLPRVTRGGNR